MPNTWNCASASYADVNYYAGDGAGAGLVANGDTVTIPADTQTWSSTLTITKAIHLKGAGVTSTYIRNGVSNGQLINWTAVSGQAHRLSAMEFNDGGGGFGVGLTFTFTNAASTTLRVDHCKFNRMNGTQCAFDTCVGVFDHNEVIPGPAVGTDVPIRLYARRWNEPPAVGEGTVGDGSWYAATNWGSSETFYIESNTFTMTAGDFAGMTDGWNGCRFVARYNTVTRGQFTVHGTESPGRQRGSKQIEIYRNTIAGKDDTTFQSVVDIRSGLGLIWDNTTTNFAIPSFNLTADRLFYPFQPWDTADGRNRFDTNTGGGPFESGTASSGPSGQTLTDSSKTWSNDQWVGYSIVKTSGTSQTQVASTITTNDAHSITYLGIAGFSGTAMTFTTGDGYSLYKVAQAFDAPGRAGGSLMFHQHITSLVRSGVGNTTETITSPVSFASMGIATNDYIVIFNANTLTTNTCFGVFQVTVTSAVPPYTATYTVVSDAGADFGSEVYLSKIPASNDQTTEGCYEWNNVASDLGGTYIHFAPYSVAMSQFAIHANEHYYQYVSSGYNGTSGVGRGTAAQMNAITPSLTGTAFWVTDEGGWNTSGDGRGSGRLYRWNGSSWVLYYTPYTYPHPLISDPVTPGTASFPQQTPPTPSGPRGGRVMMT